MSAYLRPASIDEALTLLESPGVHPRSRRMATAS